MGDIPRNGNPPTYVFFLPSPGVELPTINNPEADGSLSDIVVCDLCLLQAEGSYNDFAALRK